MICSPTVGLLFPGEMGAGFGKLLTASGVRVITCLQGRSARTVQLSRDAGIEPMQSLGEVASQSSLLFSLVETSAAVQVAQTYASAARLAPPGAIFVDANSVGPETSQKIATIVSDCGCEFVDGAINGPAKTISTGGTFFLSGPRADDVAGFLAPFMRVRVLGPEIGRASTMKMLLGGLTKGLCALFLELASTAQERQMLPEMTEACTMIYPGITTLIDRMLPTYARHAGRRSAETRELEQTLRNSGIEPCVIAAVREMHERLAALPFDPSDGANVASLVQQAIAGGLLAAVPASLSAGHKVA
jgi:3-hydroxyisobutyrate dehydrogenase-like beta-hydroxyacid dehydrogenase